MILLYYQLIALHNIILKDEGMWKLLNAFLVLQYVLKQLEFQTPKQIFFYRQLLIQIFLNYL